MPNLCAGFTTGEAQVFSAIALSLLTALLAWFAFDAVREARRTRKQAVRPALGLDLVTVGGNYVEVGVVNVGQGAALDVDLELAFMPDLGDAEPVRLRWTWPLIRPGQSYQFAPPTLGKSNRPVLKAWAERWPRVTLTGTVRDALDHEHRIEVELLDVVGLRERAIEATMAHPLRETAAQRDMKKLRKAAESIDSTLGRVAAALQRGRE